VALSLYVRQHEIIIVQGSENQNLVFDLFTTGMNPCVGLVLWHPKFCALAHVDDVDDIPQFAPVVAQFSKHCEAERGTTTKPFALVVMAHGVGGGQGWWSEHMKTNIIKLCENSKIAVDVVRPMKPGDNCAMVKVNVSNGACNFHFDPAEKGVEVQRKPETEGWYRTPIGSVFRFGFFRKVGEEVYVAYVKGTDSAAVESALAESE